MAAKPEAKNDPALDEGPLQPEEGVINEDGLESLTPQARDAILNTAAAADAWLDQGMRMTWTRWLELGNGIALMQQECMRAAGGRNDPQGAAYRKQFKARGEAHPWLLKRDKNSRKDAAWCWRNRVHLDAFRRDRGEGWCERVNHPTSVRKAYEAAYPLLKPAKPKRLSSAAKTEAALSDTMAKLEEARRESIDLKARERDAEWDIAAATNADARLAESEDLKARNAGFATELLNLRNEIAEMKEHFVDLRCEFDVILYKMRLHWSLEQLRAFQDFIGKTVMIPAPRRELKPKTLKAKRRVSLIEVSTPDVIPEPVAPPTSAESDVLADFNTEIDPDKKPRFH